MKTRRGIWVLLPFAVFTAADVALTLYHQPATYRAGEWGSAVEANPLARPLLVRGPGWFVVGALLWALGVGLICICTEVRFVGWCVACAAIAHAFGGAAWLARSGPMGLFLAVAYLVTAVVICKVCWRLAR